MEQINLNLIPGRALPVCHASQYDVGRTIRCNLFEGDQVFAFASGDTAELHLRKPDDTVITAALTVTASNTYIDISTTQQMTACAGSVLSDIVITRSGNSLGTLNFIMEVEADPVSDGDPSESVIRDLQAQVDELTNDRFLEFMGITREFVDLQAVTLEEGKYISNFSTGAIGSNNLFLLTDYIAIPSDCFAITVNRVVYHPTSGQSWAQSQMVEFYDSNKNVIGAQSTTINGNNLNITITNGNCKYMRVNLARYKVLPFIRIDRFPLGGVATNINDLDITDLNDLPYNGIFLMASTSSTIAHQPETNFTGLILTLSNRGKYIPGAFQVAIRNLNKKVLIRSAWGSPTAWSDWLSYTDDAITSALGIVGSYSGTFTGNETKNTGITLKAGASYIIQFVKKPPLALNLFLYGDNNHYEQVSFENSIIFKNTLNADRALVLYNGGVSQGDVEIKVYTLDSIKFASEQVPKKYIVSKDSRFGNYTSVTECFLALKDDTSPKIIEIWEGTYDIYQEYVDANVPVYSGDSPATDYYDYCVWVPENSHVIGKGNVKLVWMPLKADTPITYAQCYTVSPLNVAKNAIIENIEIHCKNGRYCIHNDSYTKPDIAGVRQTYINVRCYKYQSEQDDQNRYFGTHHVLGFGISRSMHQKYENCFFKNTWDGRAFYGHTNAVYNTSTVIDTTKSGNFELNNCIMDTAGAECVKFGNTGTTQKWVPVFFSNCYFSGQINAINEGGGDALPNAYDLTFLNCGDVNVHIADPSNPYAPKAYRTNVTLN